MSFVRCNMSDRKRSIFSYSKSEFRGILVLAVLMAVLLFVRIRQYSSLEKPEILISERIPEGGTVQGRDPEMGSYRNGENKTPEKSVTILPVDPNLAGYTELKAAGLSAKAASNLIRYREAGGRFASVSEMKKIYGLDSVQLGALAHNFRIEPEGNGRRHNSKTGTPDTFRTELNRADPAELARLPGIGEVLATRIIRYRELLGGYYSAHQLSEVYGLDDSLEHTLLKHLSVDTGMIKKTDLNRASFGALEKHPYLNSFQARSIMEFRRLEGSFPSIKTLIDNHLLTSEEYEKLRHYLEVEPE